MRLEQEQAIMWIEKRILRMPLLFLVAHKWLKHAVAYLECAQGGGPPSGVQGQSPGRGLGARSWSFFVNECLNFDVFEEKLSKTAKNTIVKNYGRLKGGQAQGPPPKYATGNM